MNIKKVFLVFMVISMLFQPISKLFVSAEKYENLAAGKTYTVETGDPVANSYWLYPSGDFNNGNGQLTDGKSAPASDYSSPNWYKSMRGKSRIITIDLGEEKAINGFFAGFLHNQTEAYYAPRYLYFFLSQNGEDYQCISEYDSPVNLADKIAKRADFDFTFDVLYKARYVKIEYCVDIFAACDEIKIMGASVTGSEKELVPDKKAEEPGVLKDMNGIKNIIKIYNGYLPSEQSKADNTVDELMPYLVYMDKYGNYSDTMFDSVAFVPCHTDYPSGGRLVKTNQKPGAVMSDWLLYLEKTFQDNYDASALNTAIGTVHEKLNIEKAFPVLFTLPYPTVINGKFGDLYGDGNNIGCSTLEERLEILKWYVDLTYETYLGKGYENLKFQGFYWYREEVNYTETGHEDLLVKEIAEYIRSKGFSFIYDPFFLATGYDEYEELGFTAGVMQPNLANDREYFNFEMLEEFGSIIKKYNLGVEMETPEPGYFNGADYQSYVKKYEAYLYYGWKTGYMDALKTFYQGAGPGALFNFYKAVGTSEKDISMRSLYDKTYEFLKGTYEYIAPSIHIDDFTIEPGKKNLQMPITITGSEIRSKDYSVTLTRQPSGGKVSFILGNTKIMYSANADFIGEDSFEVYITDSYNQSETITVKVSVLESASNNSQAPQESTAEQPSEQDINPSGVKTVLIVCGVVAITVVSLLFVIKKRKNKNTRFKQ